MFESSEDASRTAESRGDEEMGESPEAGIQTEAGHPVGGAGAPEEGEGAASMKSTPEISTEDQGGDQTGPLPGEHQGTPAKE